MSQQITAVGTAYRIICGGTKLPPASSRQVKILLEHLADAELSLKALQRPADMPAESPDASWAGDSYGN